MSEDPSRTESIPGSVEDKEGAVKSWAESLEGKEPNQVIGEFMAAGARVNNFIMDPDSWRPRRHTTSKGREVVLPSGTVLLPNLAIKSLERSLPHSLRIKPAKDYGTQELFMAIYPKVSGQTGEVDPQGSIILILNRKQMDDLRHLTGLPEL